MVPQGFKEIQCCRARCVLYLRHDLFEVRYLPEGFHVQVAPKTGEELMVVSCAMSDPHGRGVRGNMLLYQPDRAQVERAMLPFVLAKTIYPEKEYEHSRLSFVYGLLDQRLGEGLILGPETLRPTIHRSGTTWDLYAIYVHTSW